jgi:hypothetical protein
MQKEDDHYSTWSDEEVDALCGRIAKAIDDNCLILNSKDKLVRADDYVTRIAMVAWLTSPSQYERERATGIEIRPSQRTMYRRFKKIHMEPGHFSCTYGMLRDRTDELGKTGTQHGGIMCDELKFKSVFFVSNFKDGMTVAMAASSGMKDLRLVRELEHLVEREDLFDANGEEAGENFKDATHVNSF